MLTVGLCGESCTRLYVEGFLDARKYRYALVDFAPQADGNVDFLIATRYPLIDVARRDYSHGERCKIHW